MGPKAPRRMTKRQQMAQALKQNAMKNLIAAKTVLNKEPLTVNPQMKKLTTNNVASDVLVWRS